MSPPTVCLGGLCIVAQMLANENIDVELVVLARVAAALEAAARARHRDELRSGAWAAARYAVLGSGPVDRFTAGVAYGWLAASVRLGRGFFTPDFEEMCGAVAAAQILSGVWP